MPSHIQSTKSAYVYRLLFFISTAIGIFPFLWYFVVSYEQSKGTNPDLCARALGVSHEEALDGLSSKMYFFPPHFTCLNPQTNELSVHLLPVNWLLLAWVVAVFALVKGILAHIETPGDQSPHPATQQATWFLRTTRRAVATWLVVAALAPTGIFLLALGQAVYSLALLVLAGVVLVAGAAIFIAGSFRPAQSPPPTTGR